MVNVPFKGDTDGAIALAGHNIDVHFAVPVSYKSLVESKKVRILAVASDERSPVYANLPTFKENGLDLTIGAFHGIFVPAGTPDAVKQKVEDALKSAVDNPELKKRMRDAGAAIVLLQGDEAKAYLARQDDTYRGIIDTLGLHATANQ